MMRSLTALFISFVLTACASGTNEPINSDTTSQDASLIGEDILSIDSIVDSPAVLDVLKDDTTVIQNDVSIDTTADIVSIDSPPAPDILQLDMGICPPPNDTCANATVLTMTGNKVTVAGDNTCATDDLDLPYATSCTGYDTPGYDLFYKITLQPGTYNVSLKQNGYFDPAMYILPYCGGDCIVGSDVVGPRVETVTLTPTTTTTYIIVADAYDTWEVGSFNIEVVAVAITPDGAMLDGIVPTDAGVDSPGGDTALDSLGDFTVDLTIDGITTDGNPAPNIVITEIMADPNAVTDANGEWFEIYNAGSSAVNLQNWIITDQPGTAQNTHTIATALNINPGQYLVLGINNNTTTNGGVTVNYSYGTNWYLANRADEIYLYDPNGTLIDKVEYADVAGYMFPTAMPKGASISLKNPSLNNNVAVNWCQETTAWTGSSGDKGTPGAAAGCQ